MKTPAQQIVSQLTPEQIAYTVSPDRGEYRGFAALHDLMDANCLLLEVSPLPDGPMTEETLNHYNAISSEVTALLLA